MLLLRSSVTTLLLAAAPIALTAGTADAQKRQRNVITREEIMASAHKEQDIYQVIRSLRPHFLQLPAGTRTLGNSRPNELTIAVDGKRETDVNALRTIIAKAVEEVRYLDPVQSENEFGPRSKGGAVLVKLYDASKAVAKDTVP